MPSTTTRRLILVVDTDLGPDTTPEAAADHLVGLTLGDGRRRPSRRLRGWSTPGQRLRIGEPGEPVEAKALRA